LVTTHPVQYQVPWFRELGQCGNIDLKVFFGMIPDQSQQGVGFGTEFSWDIPMLDGYPWEVCGNVSKQPGLDAFYGCNTPDIHTRLKQFGPDVVISTGWQSRSQVQAGQAARKQSVPVILRGDSNAMKPRSVLKNILHRIYLGKFQAFLAVGKSNREFYLAAGVPGSRIFAAPHFIENRRFTSIGDQGARDRMRRQMKISEQDFCFIYSGKLTEKKRVMDLLEGLKILNEREAGNYHAQLLIVGDGEQAQTLKDFVNRHSLPVIFQGFVNQSGIPSMYRVADCLLLSSDYGETWGLVVNEAMASGLPAIISDRAGCGPDLIRQGETGFTYPFGDVRALAAYMVQLAQNPDSAKAMGAKARANVLENHSIGKTVSATLEAIRYVTA
jgi:glycosyltransferase involved in cell wall biosynthesis